MSKKSAKIAATYFFTIIFSLVLIGGVSYFVITGYLNFDDEGILPTEIAETTIPAGEYAPAAEDCQTILFIYDAEKRVSGSCFVLARFIPTDNKVVIVPLQSDIYAQVNGQSNTLYEFYRLGGTADAVKAVENALGVAVDRYMKFSSNSFTVFANFMGNISYNVPYNLVYENKTTGENTVMKSGEQILDSEALKKVITFPEFKGGEEYRATVLGTLTVDLVNSGSKGILRDGMDTVFSDIINSDVETNITRYDYEERKMAISYVLDNNASPAQLVLPSGVYDENGAYVLDSGFINSIPSRFALASE